MSDVEHVPTNVQKLSAEALGTFVLVLFGVGSVLAAGRAGAAGDAAVLSYTAVGLAFGFAVLVMAFAVGGISGGHFNPAVSVGAAFSGRLSWLEAGLYSAAQVAGAIAASIVLFLIMMSTDTGYEIGDGLGANGFGDHGGVEWWGALLVEIVFTAVFLYVILAVTDARHGNQALAPVAIGIALAAIHFASMGFTGTSVNPARSIGPALFSGSDAIVQLLLFIPAPLIGAAIAGLTYPMLFGRDAEPVPGSGLNFSRPAPAAAAWGAEQQQWGPGQQQWSGQQPWGGQEQQWQGQQPPEQQQWQAQQGQQEQQEQQAQQGQQQWDAGAIQQQYPGWQWDAATQQWVPDQSAQQQWGAPDAGGQAEEPRTQVRPPDDQA